MQSTGRVLKRQRVAGELRESILSGSFPHGTLLPGENELAQRFEVSRTTIRGVLEGLAKDRLIETQTGVGSLVIFNGVELDQTQGWGTALALGGLEVTADMLRLERLIDPDLAASVGSDSLEFLAVDRIRRLPDGTAVSLERSRVPWVGALTRVPAEGLVDNSLSASLAAAGLVAARGDQWIAASPLDAVDAQLLGREPQELFLNTVRVARDTNGRFVERVVSWLDPTHFRLHVSFGS